MKFVGIWKIDPATAGRGPTQQQMEQMGALIGEMTKAGALLDTGGVMGGGASFRVRRSGSEVTVTDGPFTESKEVIGGFVLLDADTKDEAERWIRRFVDCAGDGEAELHQLAEYS